MEGGDSSREGSKIGVGASIEVEVGAEPDTVTACSWATLGKSTNDNRSFIMPGVFLAGKVIVSP